MTAANNFLARSIAGQFYYKSAAAWEYRFIKAVADLKVLAASNGGSEQPGTLTLIPTRTTIPAHAGVFVDLDLSALTASPTWWRECEIIWDFGKTGEVYKSAKRSEYGEYLDDEMLPDFLGRSARFSKSHLGGTAFKKPGSYDIRVFVLDTVSNNWAEASVTITVVDPLTLYDATNTFVVAIDNDFTGAPPSNNQFTDPVAAVDAMAAFDTTSALFFKGGESFRATTFPSGLFREDDADFYMGTWNDGVNTWDADKFFCYLDSDGRDDFIRVLECNAFTFANLHFQGFYNPHATQSVTIDGEAVAPGMVGGANDNAENFGFYIGFGGNVQNKVACRNVTLSNCASRNVQYFRVGSCFDLVLDDCDMRDWSSFGIFCEYTNRMARNGVLATVPRECQEVENQARDLSIRPLAPLHGGMRLVICPETTSSYNIVSARSGWFGADSSQPSDRYYTMTNEGIGEIDEAKISAFNEYCIGGDVSYIQESANPNLDTYPSKFAIYDGVVVQSTKHMYDGTFRMSYGNTIMKNCVPIIPREAKVGLNQCWQAVNVWRNGGPADPTVAGTLATILAVDPNTVEGETGWPSDVDISVQAKSGEWVYNAKDQSAVWNQPFNATLTEAQILALDPNTVDLEVYEATDTTRGFYSVGGAWLPFRNGQTPLGDYNGSVPSIYSSDFYTTHFTVINRLGVGSSGRPYAAFRNATSFTDSNPAFPNNVNTGLLDYVEAPDGQDLEANILALDPVALDGQAWWATDVSVGYFAQDGAWVPSNGNALVPATADPQFDEQLVPQAGATTAAVPYRRLDLYLNVIDTPTPFEGAVQAGTIY